MAGWVPLFAFRSQDKFLLRNDNVLPATLQRIKKELDLQRAIWDAQEKLREAMDAHAPYEVRVCVRVCVWECMRDLN